MKINKLDRLFRDGLSTRSVEPSPAAWHQLEGQLRHKKRGAFWRWTAAAAVLLLLSWVGWTNLDRNNTEHILAESSNVPINPKIDRDTMTCDLSTDVIEDEENLDESLVSEQEQVSPTEDIRKNMQQGEIAPELSKPTRASRSDLPPEGSGVLATGEKHISADTEETKSTQASYPGQETNPEETLALAAIEEPVTEKVPIRIVYKRGKTDGLSASGNGNLAKKGFKKLGGLTADIKMSEEAKERWKSRKDDILAFNIEKIFKETTYETEQR